MLANKSWPKFLHLREGVGNVEFRSGFYDSKSLLGRLHLSGNFDFALQIVHKGFVTDFLDSAIRFRPKSLKKFKGFN